MRILAIDPSVNQLGFATLQTEPEEEWNWGMWELSGINFVMRCADARDYIVQELGDEWDHIVIEWPEYFDSQRGEVAAKMGYTINLAGIGMYVAGYLRVPHQNIYLYTPHDWKGQVKKMVTARRFYKHFGVEMGTVDHNAIDATMMLLHHCNLHKIKAQE